MIVYLRLIDAQEDKNKFEQLYNTYRQPMLLLSMKILHHKEDAEDAVHQAFIKIAENLDKIEKIDDSMTKSFIVTIIKNKSIDLYRKNKIRHSFELREWDLDQKNDCLWDNTLSSCIAKLPDNYRDMILLKYYYGYSTKEVAVFLEISDLYANKLDQRAKKKLEELYQNNGEIK